MILEDYIDQVYCKDVVVPLVKNKNRESVVIQIKVITGRTSSIIISYSIENERERVMLESKNDCEVIYGDDNQFYIYDSNRGLTDMKDYTIHFEYHVADKNK